MNYECSCCHGEVHIPLASAWPTQSYDLARQYARLLVDHVEQCWASAVLR